MSLDSADRTASEGLSADEEPLEYQAIVPLAPLAALLGLISFVAFLHPVLCVVPVVAAVVGWLALRRIAEDPELLTGTGMAWLGLGLGVFVLVAVPTHAISYQLLLLRESRQVSDTFVHDLLTQHPELAHQFTLEPGDRAGQKDAWDFYRSNPLKQHDLRLFVQHMPVRTMLALGERSTARHFGSNWLATDAEAETLRTSHAFTYDRDGQRTTFFFCLHWKRWKNDGTWQMITIEDNCRPEAWLKG